MASFGVHAGRLIHWVSVICATLALIVTANWYYQEQQSYSDAVQREAAIVRSTSPAELALEQKVFGPNLHSTPAPSNDDVYLGLVAAVLIAIVGRGMRYILSAE